MTAAQGENEDEDEGEWLKMAEHGAERFMTKWIAAEWTMVCSCTLEPDGKDQGKDSPKQACSCWFARHILLTTRQVARGGYVVRFPSGWCFLPFGHGLNFDISLCDISIKSINQSIMDHVSLCIPYLQH